MSISSSTTLANNWTEAKKVQPMRLVCEFSQQRHSIDFVFLWPRLPRTSSISNSMCHAMRCGLGSYGKKNRFCEVRNIFNLCGELNFNSSQQIRPPDPRSFPNGGNCIPERMAESIRHWIAPPHHKQHYWRWKGLSPFYDDGKHKKGFSISRLAAFDRESRLRRLFDLCKLATGRKRQPWFSNAKKSRTKQKISAYIFSCLTQSLWANRD